MKATQIDVFNLLQKAFSKEEAEKIVTFISEQNVEGIDDLKKIFPAKDDKIDLLSRMDSHFKWLTGIVITMFSLAIAILKLT